MSNEREDDDGRYFEDFTVFGEYEGLVKQFSGPGLETVPFRGAGLLCNTHHASRHELLDSIDYYSFTEEIPLLFNLDSDHFSVQLEDGTDHYLSMNTAKLVLGAASTSKPDVPCFVRFGRDGNMIIGTHFHRNLLYSFIPCRFDVAGLPDKCSAMVSLSLGVPWDGNWRKSLVSKEGIAFPVWPLQSPVGRYKLRGIFPQADSRCVVEGLDALAAPIILLSSDSYSDIVCQSEVFLAGLAELAELAQRPPEHGTNGHGINAKTRLLGAKGTNLNHRPYLSSVFRPSEENIGVRLFRAALACLYDNPHHMIQAIPTISGLWSEVVGALRQIWMEKRASLLDIHEQPNWDEPLVYQKLSMVKYCMLKTAADLSSDDGEPNAGPSGDNSGIREPLAGQYLQENPEQQIMAPFTQSASSDPPVMTSDQFAHYQSALQRYPLEERNRLHALPLLSDMQAFKAANPGSVLVDFLKWYSPKDIVASDDGQPEVSERMRGGLWTELWEEARPVPAHGQPLLFSPWREGEKALFYLEDLSVADLLSQLVSAGLFDIGDEHGRIKESLLVEHGSTKEVLVASEDERDRVQSLFRAQIAHLFVEQQCFAFPCRDMVLVKRHGRTWMARKE